MNFAQAAITVRLEQAVSRLDECTVINSQAGWDVPAGSNSVVRFSIWKITQTVLEASLPVFTTVYGRDSSIVETYPNLKEKRFTVDDLILGSNYVEVFGGAPEPMHIHATTIVAHVVQGTGVLLHRIGSTNVRTTAGEGDTIVIPAGAPHFFHGTPRITYTGIEFGPVIDYQKHHSQ